MIAFLLSFTLGAAITPAVPPVVRQADVREVTLEKEVIHLGDVIPLEGWDARAQVELGRAPEPGRARAFQNYELISRIRGAGFAEDGLTLPAEVVVRRASRRLEEEEVRRAIEESLRSRFPESQTSIVELTVPAADVSTGPVEVSAGLPENFRPGSVTSVRIDVVGEDYSRTFHLRATLTLEVAQPVLRHDVSAQSVVRPDDIERVVLPLESSTSSIMDVRDLGGYVAKHDLPAGSVLTKSVLYSPIMVRRGETVAVEARVGNIVVAAVMEAEESGKYGDVIEVGHLSGDGRTRVRIIGPGRVEALVESTEGRNQ